MKLIRLSIVAAGLTGLFLPLKIQFLSIIILTLLVLKYDYTILKQFTNKGVLVITFILLVFQPLISGVKDTELLSVGFSFSTFYSSLQMVLRAFFLITTFSVLIKSIDKNLFLKTISKINLKNFKPAYDDAQLLLPVITKTLTHSLKNYRKDRRRILLNPVNFAAFVVVSIIKDSQIILKKNQGFE